jgi:hypothetical protein
VGAVRNRVADGECAVELGTLSDLAQVPAAAIGMDDEVPPS